MMQQQAAAPPGSSAGVEAFTKLLDYCGRKTNTAAQYKTFSATSANDNTVKRAKSDTVLLAKVSNRVNGIVDWNQKIIDNRFVRSILAKANITKPREIVLRIQEVRKMPTRDTVFFPTVCRVRWSVA